MDKQNIAIVILAAILIGVGAMIFDQASSKRNSLGTENLGQTQPTPAPSVQPTPSTKIASQSASAKKETMKKTYSQPPAMQLKEGIQYQAVLKTSKGDITIDLNSEATPITVNNFVSLAKDGFYNETIFHRTIAGFMIQGGDPEGTGMGGPGYRFADEDFEGEYSRGTVAMANAGPNTNGSQFFIMHQDYPLPPNYVIFGKVSKGIEVVDAIATAPTTRSTSGENSKPVTPVTVNSVEMVEK